MTEGTVFKISEKDNVAVALRDLQKGEVISAGGVNVCVNEEIPANFKIALNDIETGKNVIKYGFPIGIASDGIRAGSLVHTHNLKSCLSGRKDYNVSVKPLEKAVSAEGRTFYGYRRKNGSVGIRNEIYIIPTVGCVNDICQRIAEKSAEASGKKDIYVFKHPYGCSQLGGDHENTRKILKGLALHPNAGGVLIVSLGCENNNLEEFKKFLGGYDKERIRFLKAQDSGDETEKGKEIVKELADICSGDKREPCFISELKVGLKCGGSDSLSGITANPLVGAVCDKLAGMGAGAIMTEVPEMFGAEHILMERSRDNQICSKIIDMVNSFKDYFLMHGEKVSENPSPGNREGGITTLEEKSLGCIQKGGTSVINDVLKYGERIKCVGLNLLEAPGNDIVAQTALAAAGAHLILFTTGRGTPLGAAVPTIKISTNSALAAKKPDWIDFDAGSLLCQKDMETLSGELLGLIIEIANGKQTRNEINGCRDFAIWKNGVTL